MEEQSDLGYEVLGIDWTVEPKVARELTNGKNLTLQGNMDPCALYADDQKIRAIVKEMIENFGTKSYIVNLGHGIYPDAHVDAVDTFIKAVHDFAI